MTLFKIVLIRS